MLKEKDPDDQFGLVSLEPDDEEKNKGEDKSESMNEKS